MRDAELSHRGYRDVNWLRRTALSFVTNDANNGLTGSRTNPINPFPSVDTLTVNGQATPAAYSHRDGDAISSGFV